MTDGEKTRIWAAVLRDEIAVVGKIGLDVDDEGLDSRETEEV